MFGNKKSGLNIKMLLFMCMFEFSFHFSSSTMLLLLVLNNAFIMNSYRQSFTVED